MTKFDQIYDSADELPPQEPPPFFTTRALARLDRRLDEKPTGLVWGYKRPVWVVAVLVICLGLNMATIAVGNRPVPKSASVAPSTDLQGFAKEFDLVSGYQY
jgi:hypothetical protein